MSTLYNKIISTSSHKKYKVNVERYESALEVVKHCKERPITDDYFDDKSKKTFGEWEGVKTYEEALDYLKNGYQPTVDRLKETVKANKMGDGKRIKFENNVYGFSPVVPLALMGVPNSMINMTMKPIKCKVVDVYYDMTCSCGTSSGTIIKNGQKLLAAIMSLEQQGYKFNLFAVQSYSGSADADMLIVKIKSSSNPIDLKRMSFPLTHTAFFRVIGFDWYSRTPHGKFRCGYGHALSYEFNSSEMNDFAKQMFGNNALFLRGTDIKDNGEEHIKEVLIENEKNNKNR
ncbi:MAG TPA: hypothetical protein DHV37_06030 [Erysipelotrichaceae bacterium]|nr:hypothetical protein [Erysipelotrichaceae bacterium]